MPTVTQVQLVAPQQVAGSDTAYYTAPSNTTVKIGRAVFTNTTAGAVTVTAAVTNGGAISAGNTLISARSLAAGESYVSPELAGIVVPAGSQIRASAGAGASITIAVSGLTIV